MSENEIAGVMSSVWPVVGTAEAGARDQVIFELYHQRQVFREALERIAAYPYKGWSQQIAEKALEALNQPAEMPQTPVKPNKAVEMAVNRGLAATVLRGLSAGVEVMCKEGVPPDVVKRVLLHPTARRATDWLRPQDVLTVNPEKKLVRPRREQRRAA